MSYLIPPDYATISQTDALVDRLETPQFDATVHLASGVRAAVRIVREHPSVRSLTRHLSEHPHEVKDVLARIEQLAKEPIDRQWSSPHEAALLALLVAVHDAAPHQAHYAVALAAGAPNAPWVQRYGSEIAPGAPPEPALHVALDVVASPHSRSPALVLCTPAPFSSLEGFVVPLSSPTSVGARH